MDIKHSTNDDGATVGQKAVTTYIAFNDESCEDGMGISTTFHRPVAMSDKDTPGRWLAGVDTAEIGIGLDRDSIEMVPDNAWVRGELEGSFDSAKDARSAAFLEVCERGVQGEIDFSRQVDPEAEAFDHFERASEGDFCFDTGRMSFNDELGRDAASASFADAHGFFFDGACDENGWSCYRSDEVRREARHEDGCLYFEPGSDIPYETGAVRPTPDVMAEAFRRHDGNLVKYARENRVGLVDALRDSLISGQMTAKHPVALAILEARVDENAGRSSMRDLSSTITSLKSNLSEVGDNLGLDTRDEMVKLSAAKRASANGSEDRTTAAVSFFDVIAESRRYGIDTPMQSHKEIATFAMSALSDLMKSRDVRKTRNDDVR